MINRLIIFVLLITLLWISCDLISPEPSDVSLRISQHILQGYFVTAISFDSKGTAWIGTFKQGMIRYDGTSTVYNSQNSILPDSVVIWSIEVDRNDNIWLGTNAGLIKYDRKKFTVYNTTNSQLAENIVWAIAVDRSNTLWLASCRFRLGGLMKFDGTNWTLFTPENSPLPSNSITDIAIDGKDNIWVSVNTTLNNSRIIQIEGDTWTLYDDNNIGFSPYNFLPGNLTIDRYNNIYASIDYMLSSYWDPSRPNIIVYDNTKWTILKPVDGNGNPLGYVRKIGTDLSGNLWAGLWGREDITIAVYNGDKWIHNSPGSPIDGIHEIKTDRSNTVWLGTADGVYLVRQ
jgi:ligand-binding sensor domain-containing protein